MADDVLITPASRKIEFKDSDGNVDAVIQTDASGNLEITNVGGNISIGDTTSDVYIGDGTNNVDIVFEQDGEIRGTSGVTVTVGASGATTNLAGTVQLGGTTLTATGTELNYTDGVTSNIQTQLNAKASASIATANTLTSASATQQVVDSWATATYISAKYICQIKDSDTTKRQSSEVLVVHDGSSAFITEYAIVDTDGIIATFQADISAGNVRLLVTPTVTNSVIKVIRTAITS